MVACSGGAQLNSGIEGEKKLNELDQVEVQTLCSSTNEAWVELDAETQEGACKFDATVTALRGAEEFDDALILCEAQLAQCDGAMAGTSVRDDCVFLDTTCDATVAEAEACFNDSVAETKRLLNDFAKRSCLELLDPAADEEYLDVMEHASCLALRAKCLDFRFGFLGED